MQSEEDEPREKRERREGLCKEAGNNFFTEHSRS